MGTGSEAGGGGFIWKGKMIWCAFNKYGDFLASFFYTRLIVEDEACGSGPARPTCLHRIPARRYSAAATAQPKTGEAGIAMI
jgi:hypothetical protein